MTYEEWKNRNKFNFDRWFENLFLPEFKTSLLRVNKFPANIYVHKHELSVIWKHPKAFVAQMKSMGWDVLAVEGKLNPGSNYGTLRLTGIEPDSDT